MELLKDKLIVQICLSIIPARFPQIGNSPKLRMFKHPTTKIFAYRQDLYSDVMRHVSRDHEYLRK